MLCMRRGAYVKDVISSFVEACLRGEEDTMQYFPELEDDDIADDEPPDLDFPTEEQLQRYRDSYKGNEYVRSMAGFSPSEAANPSGYSIYQVEAALGLEPGILAQASEDFSQLDEEILDLVNQHFELRGSRWYPIQ